MAVNPMMESAMSAGVNGMNSGLRGMSRAAQEVSELNVARRNTGTEDVTLGSRPKDLDDAAESLTSLKLYARQVQATAKVVETADEVLGFLLDIHA